MNFKGTWGALDEAVTYFWKIAVPVTCFILLVIAAPYFGRAQRRFKQKQRNKSETTARENVKWRLRRRKSSIQ